MGDVVTCKAVLKKAVDPTRPDFLFLSPAHQDYRDLPCHEKGKPKGGTPEWEYEIRGDRLHITPSMHCTDTGFHTDFHWSVAFELKPEGVDAMTHFFAINPDRTP